MKLYLRTFGCRANHYDSETVRAAALDAGCEVVDDAQDADVAVFNSCAVTSQAERDLRKAVRGVAKENPRLRSVIMGCASALPHNGDVLRALPTVASVIGGTPLDAIASAIGIATPSRPPERQSTVRANLRIQDGCDEHCTFCATTRARGANRSRQIPLLVDEARALAEHHPEIVITGTHIGAYGAETGSSLGALIQELVLHVPAVRFRLSSVEATEVDERLMELFASSPSRLAPHLHAPLQSGSDRLLRRMGRHWYDSRSYAESVERLAARVSVLGLGADVIVGFPGETDADFRSTVELVERLPFTYLHVFPYSPRPGTAALRLPDRVAQRAAHDRASELRSIAAAKAAAHRMSRSGTTADVVVISAFPQREGLTEDYLTVRVSGRPRARGERIAGVLRIENDVLVLNS